MTSNKLVSIIIPTYNSATWINTCLASIQKQSYPSIEVIIVDNHSIDRTLDIATIYNATIIVKKSERAIARNVGIRQAKGTYILSIDSDMELEKDVVSDCVNIFENYTKVGGVVIPEISVGTSYWVKLRNYERSFYEYTKIESARFFKKELIEKVSGYEEDIVFFEESTLPQKIEQLGYNINLRIKSHIRHHEDNFNILHWLKKKFYYSQNIGIYQKKYHSYANDQMNPFYRFEIFFKNKDKDFFSRPFLAFGVLVLKTFEYLFSGLGYIFS